MTYFLLQFVGLVAITTEEQLVVNVLHQRLISGFPFLLFYSPINEVTIKSN